MGHSVIAPSSAGIWGKTGGCPGWVTMAQLYPQIEESQDSKEGTASHEIGAGIITGAMRGGLGAPTRETTLGKPASNGVIFTEEMFDAAEVYAQDVAAIMLERAIFGGPYLGIEKHVIAKRIHDLSEGTVDSFIYDSRTKDLFLWDYKYGHDIVEVFENWQLMNYCSGVLDSLGINGIEDQLTTVHFRVVQPRAHHRDGIIREWIIKASNLRAYFNILNANAHKALGPNPQCHTGSHCKNCTARHACAPALAAGTRLYEVASAPVPSELSKHALGVQLAMIQRAYEQVKLLKTAYEAQVDAFLRKGVVVPGWSLQPSAGGRENWTKPVSEVLALGDCMGLDLRKDDAAITPNQARKKGLSEELIKTYSARKNPGVSLALDNSNRIKQIFSEA
jgi:hypothetical protein